MLPISERVTSVDMPCERSNDSAQAGAVRRLCSPSRAQFLVGPDRRTDAGTR
jgi:hypothetical protein